MNQASLVYDAIAQGCRTSNEAAEITGLSVKRCSSWLSYLKDCGLVKKTGTYTRHSPHAWHVSFHYEPCR